MYLATCTVFFIKNQQYTGKKGKGHPCTGTEALYRPYDLYIYIYMLCITVRRISLIYIYIYVVHWLVMDDKICDII